MLCIKCNKEIDNDDIFCGYCGINQKKYRNYILKISKKIHNEQDKKYKKKIKIFKIQLNQLRKLREKELQRIINNRWQSIGCKSFLYNMTEGKIMINSSTYSFSDIKGAEIVKQDSFRTITNTTETSKSTSKKHSSLGGGIMGSAVAGPLGGVVGGSVLGKTTTKGKSNIVSNSNNIPTCYHIGVDVNLNGFHNEIVLLSSTVDQSSFTYSNTIKNAQMIVDKLRSLAKTSVPRKVLAPEKEQIILDLDKEIEIAAKELQDAVNDTPVYDIPEEYLK